LASAKAASSSAGGDARSEWKAASCDARSSPSCARHGAGHSQQGGFTQGLRVG